MFGGAEIDVLDKIAAAYARPVEPRLLAGFAGAELMRRLLGVAQLPLAPTAPEADLQRKRAWLELSHRWVTANV